MRPSLKISLSLLISVVLCSAFTFFAFSGLFSFLESTFYNPRVKQEYQSRVEGLQSRVDRYHRSNLQRFEERLKPAYIAESFLPEMPADAIGERARDLARLQEQLPGLIMFRLVDQNGEQLHFSTLDTDVRTRTEQSITYFLVDSLEDPIEEAWMLGAGESAAVSLDGDAQRFVYSLPVSDADSGSFKGTALFYVAVDDLYDFLIRSPEYTYGKFVPVGDLGLLFDFPAEKMELIREEVVAAWSSRESASEPLQLGVSLEGDGYLLFSADETEYGRAGVLVGSSNFELQLSMKIILLASVYLTVFLVIFLIFNLRQDPLVVISQRIKRFQIDFLQDFVESKEKLEWNRWKRDLTAKAPAIKKQMKSGIGGVRKAQQARVDELIDRSWDEMMAAIGAQA